jgi:hypothetical protein
MAVGSAKVSRVSVSETSTFTATAPTGGSTWVQVPTLDQPLPTVEQGVDDATEGNLVGAMTAPVPTTKKSGLAITTRAWTGSKRFGAGTDPTSCFNQKLLESNFQRAADTQFGGTTIAASSGPGLTTPLKVTSSTGMAVGKALRNATTYEVGFITAISGTDITLNRDFTTYTAGIEIEGAFDFKPYLGQYDKALWLNVKRDLHSWLLGAGAAFGCQLSGLAAGGGLRYTFPYEGNSFAAGVTISSDTDNGFQSTPVIAKGSYVIIGGSESICISDGSVDLSIDKEWVECAGGTQGRSGVVNTGCSKVGASWTEYYAAQRFTDYQAQTGKDVLVSFSPGTGYGAVSAWFPNVTFTPAEAAQGNKEAMTTTCRANLPTAAQRTAGILYPVYFAVHSGE